MLDMCPPAAWFLDIGAHIGKYSVKMASAGRQVVAVEANPATARTFRENVRLNGLTVELLELAAWDETTTLQLSEPWDESGSTTVLEGDGDILAVRLDDALPPHRYQLVKIDVEGVEDRVLYGMAGTVDRCAPEFIIETHDHLVPGVLARTEAFLDAHGYRRWVGYRRIAQPYIFAQHP
jgi:FkbM family methyltransferase